MKADISSVPKREIKSVTLSRIVTRARKLQMKQSAAPRRLPCSLFIKADSRRKRQQTVVDSLNSAAHFSRPTTRQLISADRQLSSSFQQKSFHRRRSLFIVEVFSSSIRISSPLIRIISPSAKCLHLPAGRTSDA